MKKALIISSSVIALTIVVLLCSYFIITAPNYIGEITISEYSDYIENENFQPNKQYENIVDYKSAAKTGKSAINDHFDDFNESIFKWWDCDISYDAVNDAYFVRTYRLSSHTFGDAYNVIIKSDGIVLAIWGEK